MCIRDRQEGVSVEVCGREVLYRFFESLLEEGEGTSLTAHHGDDNAETMLMNLCLLYTSRCV